MYFKVSFDTDFDTLMMHLWSKYGRELFDIDGIGKQCDMNWFAKNFFNSSNATVADKSVDSNSNITEKDVNVYNHEFPKPYQRYNSYYLLWKELKKIYGLSVANGVIEDQLTGKYYINDFSNVGGYYSYHPKSSIYLKFNDKYFVVSVDEFFKSVSFYADVFSDREEVDLSGLEFYTHDGSNWVKISRVLRHKSHCNLIRFETKRGGVHVVTEDHPVILSNGSEVEARSLTIDSEIKHIARDVCRLVPETKTVDPDFAYIVGAMISDGFISDKKCYLAQNNVKDTKFYSIICKLFDMVAIKKDNVVSFGGVDLSSKFYNLIGRGSCNKHLPFDFMTWDRESKLALMAALIDTDGSINKRNGCVDVRLTSFIAVQQIAELAESLGFSGIRTSIKPLSNSAKSFKSKHVLYGVGFSIKDSGIEKYSTKVLDYGVDLCFKSRGKDGRWDSDRVNKIDTISWIGEWVYDITTESGVFYSNGLLAHNCYNYSTNDIAQSGLPMIKKIVSEPPKHLYSFKSQVEQFTIIAANNSLGAK